MAPFRRFQPLLASKFPAGIAGAVVGASLVALALWQFGSSHAPLVFTPVQASATDRGSNFVIATGQIDDAMEGVFFLDKVTGTLQCAVINKTNGGVAARMVYDAVLKDVDAGGDKNPQLLMTTGLAQFVGAASGTKPSRCLVYVLNDSNGKFAIYSAPWDAGLHAKAVAGPALAPIGLVAKGDTRQANRVR